MNVLEEAKRVLAHPGIMSNPEWRTLVAGLVEIIECPLPTEDNTSKSAAECIANRRCGCEKGIARDERL